MRTFSRLGWLSAGYRGMRDGALLGLAELEQIGSPARYTYRVNGMALTVRRWTTDRLIVDEVVKRIPFPQLRAGDTVLDLGAHIGSFSILAARAGARVLAFEPEPSNFSLLEENVRPYPAVEAVPLAVAGASGTRMMRRQVRCSTSGWSFLESRGDSQRADCISLSEILEHWRLAHVDLLKLNVEGAEYKIMRASPIAVLRKARRIFLEFHDYHGQDSSEIARKLEGAGYRVMTRPEMLYRLTGIGYIDAIRSDEG